jgi:hypothetical protein
MCRDMLIYIYIGFSRYENFIRLTDMIVYYRLVLGLIMYRKENPFLID